MKLQVQNVALREASYNYHRSRPSVCAFYATGSTAIPSIVFFSNGDMSNTNNLTVAVVSVAKLKKYLQSLGSLYGKTDIWKAIYDISLNSKNEFALHPDYFKFINLQGRDKIFRYLTTDLKMPVPIFQKYFGDIPEATFDDDEHVEKFHKANLFFPETIRPNRKKNLLSMLEGVYQRLNSVGLAYLFSGDIRFTDTMKATSLGEYNTTTHDIRIKPLAENTMSVVFTIIHEFAHKEFYEFMTENDRDVLKDKFDELCKKGHRMAAMLRLQKQANHIDPEILKKLVPGTVLIYDGTKREYNKIRTFKIVSVHPSGEIRAEGGGRTIYGKPQAFVTKNWTIEGEPNNMDRTAQKFDNVADSWFPTIYSGTDYEEWYAECFTYYVFGNLRGEPLQWLTEFMNGLGRNGQR